MAMQMCACTHAHLDLDDVARRVRLCAVVGAGAVEDGADAGVVAGGVLHDRPEMQQGHLRVAWGRGVDAAGQAAAYLGPAAQPQRHGLTRGAGRGVLALTGGLGRQPGASPPQAARLVRCDAAATALWTCRATLESADQPATAGSLTDEHGTVGLRGGRVEAGWRQGGGRVEAGWRQGGGRVEARGR